MLLIAPQLMIFVLPLLIESYVLKETLVLLNYDVHTQQTKQIVGRLYID